MYKNKRYIIMMIIVLIAILSSNFEVLAESPPTPISADFHITIDGKVVEFDDNYGKPYLIKETERTIVPLRIIAEDMGYDVSWEQDLKKAIIIGNGIKVELIIGRNTALVNGKIVPIDMKDGKPVNTQAMLLPAKNNHRTYVPLRFISEITGANIEYERKNGVHFIEINTGKAIIPTPKPDPKPQPGKITFDKEKDTLPDGRMNEAKTIEYLDEIIKNSKVYTENGKYYLKYDKVDVPEGYQVGVALDITLKPGIIHIKPVTLNYNPFFNIEENTIPKNQSFIKEIRKDAVNNSDLFMFSISVYKPDYSGSGDMSSISYKINYNPIKNSAYNITSDKWGGIDTTSFDKNLIFKDFKVVK